MADGNVQPPTAATVAPAFLGNVPAPFLQSPDSDKDDWNVWLLAWNNYSQLRLSRIPWAHVILSDLSSIRVRRSMPIIY